MSNLPQPKTVTSKDTRRPFHDPKNIPQPKTVTSKDTVGSGSSYVQQKKAAENQKMSRSLSNERRKVRRPAPRSVRSDSIRPMSRSRVISEPVASAKGVIDRFKKLENSFDSSRFSVSKLNSVDHKLNSKTSLNLNVKMPSFRSTNRNLSSFNIPKMRSFGSIKKKGSKKRSSFKMPKMNFKF